MKQKARPQKSALVSLLWLRSGVVSHFFLLLVSVFLVLFILWINTLICSLITVCRALVPVAIHKFFEKDFQRMIDAITLEESRQSGIGPRILSSGTEIWSLFQGQPSNTVQFNIWLKEDSGASPGSYR